MKTNHPSKKQRTIQVFFCLIIVGYFATLQAKTIVVNNQAAGATDKNPGTGSKPLKTIQAGANLAQAGDTILVRAGIYREEVKPPRSGTKEKPVVYLAARGEEVSIRGSERITSWVDEGGGVWKVELADAFFKGFNPFAVKVSGAWLGRNPGHHLGDVYLNGEAYREKFKLAEVKAAAQTWHTETAGGKTTIRANFGGANPNAGMAEINVRATAVFPEVTGLKYIVIDGFDVRQTACQWSDIYSLEEGAIGMKYGYGWVIQNCRISNSRNNGISMGVTDEVFFSRTLSKGGDNIPPYGSFGFHIIRNNSIKRCGQCGIYGCYGAVGTVIENNEITETVYRNEWRGPNQADIKILFPIDVVVRNNRFYGPSGCGLAVWLDWGSQNARVTGNLFMDRSTGIFTEVSFGPTVVDNNIFLGSGVTDWSDGNIYAHNLFYQSRFHHSVSGSRNFVPYYKPHSTKLAGRTGTTLQHKRWHNNIFIGGAEKPAGSGFTVNNNVYLDGSPAFPNEGSESIVDKLKTNFQHKTDSDSSRISFNLSDKVSQGPHPLITSKFSGKVPLAEMFMENQDGTPLDITTDYFGNAIDPKNVMPGPFQKISAGTNKFVVWHVGSKSKSPTNR